ncbi:MAG: MFS transporter [Oscillospiraceae bacterium]|nr:MFS transporter [Oscillospiraceae bacterium]
MKQLFSKQKSIFAVCWITYVLAYLCRVNFSSAMLKISQSMQVTSSQLGAIGSAFFTVYALGQLVNGYIGDRISPYKFVTIAIVGTGILNLAVSMTNSYWVLFVLWTVNGYFQSMLWGPLMRILSQHFDRSQTVHISTGMSTSMVVGYITSWAVFGRAFLYRPWQTYFLIPALMALTAGALWIISSAERTRATAAKPKPVAMPAAQILYTIKKQRLWLVALVCLCMGLIKESLSLWAPLLLTEMLHIQTETSLLLVIIIPIGNFMGILLAGKLMRRKNDVKKTLSYLFLAAVCCSASLFITYRISPIGSVLAIAAVSGIMYGCNSLLLSYLPISFGGANIVSTLVGLFDFSSYMGAALSSALLGFALQSKNYLAVFGVWALVLTVAFGLTMLFKLKAQNPAQEAGADAK